MSVADVANDPHVPAGQPESERAAHGSGKNARVLLLVERFALPMLFLIVFLVFSFWSKTSDTFPTSANIKNVLGNQSVVGILALALIIPLVCGEFDFSVGSVAGVTQVLCAGFMSRLGYPLVISILLAILVGAVIGLSNGNTVARVGVNSLIVTLGIATVAIGFVNWYTKGQSIISGISTDLVKLGTGEWLGIPRTAFFLAAVALLVYYLLEHTPYGRYLHSIGSNPDAARLVGLPVERIVLISFVLSGALAGLAGVLLVARNGGASPQLGTIGDSIQALSAAFLGATAIKPGRFNVPGTLIAIFFLAFSVTGLSLAGVANWVNDVFSGAALFIAVLVSTILGRQRAGT